MKSTWRLARRTLTPMVLVRLHARWKHAVHIERGAEVELSGSASWGAGCHISSFTKIKIPGPFTMGRRVHIGSGCFLDAGFGGLHLGDDVVVGSGCTIVAVTYRFDRLGVPLPEQGVVSRGIRIGHRVRIGPGSVILDGSDIGDDAVVLPRSVVAGRVAPASVVTGNPLRVVSDRDRSARGA